MVRGLVSLSTLILAAVGSAAPLTPSVGTETNTGVRTVDDETKTVPDAFFYGWGEETKREEAVPDIAIVNSAPEAKRGDHREE